MKSLSISQANQSYDQKNRSFFNSNSPSKKQMMIAKKDAELLITTRPLFSKIWKQIVKLFCSTGGDLNIRTFQLIYDKFQHQIDEIYQIQTIEDFFEVFDPDKDGQLNEDEIILIFQVAKEKMNKVAQSLLDTKQYSLNRELMLCIEHFEKDIVEYQNFFRQRIYQNNLQQYNAIGDEVLDQFYLEWDLKFKQFDKQKNEEISQLNQQHIDQISELEDYLSKDVNTCKIKPKIQLKQIQKQEKLVAVVQRVEEAINFREELKKMELYEMERLNVALKNSNDKKRQKLREQQLFEKQQQSLRFESQENKLIIKMSQDLDVVQKKMKLHTNELYRIQNMLTKLNIYKGLNNGLYRREKDQAKAQGKIFEEYRLQIKDSEMQRHQSDYKLNTQNNSFISDASIVLAKGVKEIKRIASSRNNINFYLKPSFGKEAPINVSLKLGKEFELRMNQNLVKYTNPQKSNNSVQPFSLTNLYDKNLNFINQVQSINPLNNEQKASRRKILTAKLNNIQI